MTYIVLARSYRVVALAMSLMGPARYSNFLHCGLDHLGASLKNKESLTVVFRSTSSMRVGPVWNPCENNVV